MTVTVAPPEDLATLVGQMAARLSRLERRGGGLVYNDDGTVSFPGGIDTDGTGDVSVPGIGGTPDPATGLTTTPGVLYDDVYVDAAWSHPADQADLAAYELRLDLVNDPGGAETTEVAGVFVLGVVTETRLTGLRPGATYDLHLYARGATGTVAAPVTDRFVALADNTTPAAPTGLSLSAAFRTVVASWSENAEPDVADGHGIYELEVDTAGTFDTGNLRRLRVGGTLASLSDLATGTAYHARVRAIDSSGNTGPWSATATATTAQIATADLADDLITSAKIVDGAVGTVALAADAVTNAKIAVDAITATELADGAVGSEHVQALAITAAKVADSAITTAKIAADAVDAGRLADDAVGTEHLQALAVTAAEIADAAITAAKVADGTLTYTELASGLEPVRVVGTLPTLPDADYPAGAHVFLTTDGKTYRNVSGSWSTAVATVDLTGQITETQITDDAITTPKIAAGAVTATEIAAGTITATQIAADSLTAGVIAAGAITTSELATDAVTAAKIAAGTITAAEIAAGTITTAEIAAGTIVAADIASGTITSTQIAADTIEAGNIAAGAITATEIAADAVTTAKIDALAVTAAEIAAGAIVTGKIAAGAVTATEIAADTITAAQIAAGTITAAEIAADTITAAQIAAGAIATTELAADAVTTAKIDAGAVTAAEIAAGTITATQIASGTITADRMVAGTITAASGILADAVITTAKIADATITSAKISGLVADKIDAGSLTVDVTLTTGSLKVGTGPGSTGLYLDSTGLRAYSGATRTVFIDAATGDAEFGGALTGATGTFVGTLSGGAVDIGSGAIQINDTDGIRIATGSLPKNYLHWYDGTTEVFRLSTGSAAASRIWAINRTLELVSASLGGTPDTVYVGTISGSPTSDLAVTGSLDVWNGALFGGEVSPGPGSIIDLGNGTDRWRTLYLLGHTDAADKIIDCGGGFDIYVDNTGSGGSAGRFWLDTPNGGEIVLGPRSGASKINQLRLRGGQRTEGNQLPYSDNAYAVGSSSARWTDVWAVDGSINTSDGRTKTDVADGDLGLSFLLDIGGKRWKRDGGNRPHYGPVAQDVKAAMDARGVDFAGFIDPNIDPPGPDEAPDLYDDGEYVGDLPLGLRMAEFVGPIITALGELAERIEDLEGRSPARR